MLKNTWYQGSLLLLLFWACQGRAMYTHAHVLPQQKWPYTASLSFTFSIQDTTQPYDIALLVKHTQAYSYQNLFVTYKLQDESQQVWQSELKEYVLFETKTGKPITQGWGKIKAGRFMLLPAYYFAKPGNYTLNLAQFMRLEELAGIHAIGIEVLKAKQ